ncbi:hypothetical protein B7494_g8480 [Chlorociboria aeruginascens]|nr:hypothetical protein B7494_g8480 [Chlorociboria aeruginascens]
MQHHVDRNRQAVNHWTARIIPLVLAGVVGYATYVLVALLCVDYLLVKHHRRSAAIPILVIYFILFFFIGPSARRNIKHTGKDKHTSKHGMTGREYKPAKSTQPNNDPDSPGLELFYTKDVFVCEPDGRPRWCSECGNWKPDRAHHLSTAGRCAYKSDHYCPWVGGVVGESSFKYFIQFTGYTVLFCAHLLVVMAIYVHEQITNKDEALNPHFAAILGLAAFFGSFTNGMTLTSVNFAVKNLTQVEALNAKTKVYNLAVIKPPRTDIGSLNGMDASLLLCPDVVYPLSIASQSHPAQPEPPRNSKAETLEDSVNPSKESVENSPTRRDMNAFRTFTVLRTDPGVNPWDLGSRLLNFKTVMGNNIVDWFLPIKRSPCCNHEDQESNYIIGPDVNRLRATFHLMPPNNVSTTEPRHRSDKTAGLKTYRRRDQIQLRDLHNEVCNNLDRDGGYCRFSGCFWNILIDRCFTSHLYIDNFRIASDAIRLENSVIEPKSWTVFSTFLRGRSTVVTLSMTTVARVLVGTWIDVFRTAAALPPTRHVRWLGILPEGRLVATDVDKTTEVAFVMGAVRTVLSPEVRVYFSFTLTAFPPIRKWRG